MKQEDGGEQVKAAEMSTSSRTISTSSRTIDGEEIDEPKAMHSLRSQRSVEPPSAAPSPEETTPSATQHPALLLNKHVRKAARASPRALKKETGAVEDVGHTR